MAAVRDHPGFSVTRNRFERRASVAESCARKVICLCLQFGIWDLGFGISPDLSSRFHTETACPRPCPLRRKGKRLGARECQAACPRPRQHVRSSIYEKQTQPAYRTRSTTPV